MITYDKKTNSYFDEHNNMLRAVFIEAFLKANDMLPMSLHEAAEVLFDTLENCEGCIDTIYAKNCFECVRCFESANLKFCTDCQHCEKLSGRRGLYGVKGIVLPVIYPNAELL